MAEIRKKRLFRDPNDISENGKKKGDFKQGRMFSRVDKIPNANTISELVEMDFADYVDYRLSWAPMIHFRDFPRSRFRAKKKECVSAEIVWAIAISNWIAAFGSPEIMASGNECRFAGEVFQEFCTAARCNVVLQAAIPGHRQSLGRPNVEKVCLGRLLVNRLRIKSRIVWVIKNGKNPRQWRRCA